MFECGAMSYISHALCMMELNAKLYTNEIDESKHMTKRCRLHTEVQQSKTSLEVNWYVTVNGNSCVSDYVTCRYR